MCLLTSASLCLDKIPALEYNNLVSGNVGMADEQDSDSCVGYHVWVQVPFSALINIFKGVIRLIPITPFLHFIFTIVIQTYNIGYYNCCLNL